MSNVKNVAGFEELIGRCSGLEGGYNPGSPNLQLSAMNTMLTNGRAVLQNVMVAKTNYEIATNSREIAFEDLARLSTQIIGALKAVGANSQTVADARTMARRISGVLRVDRKPVPSEAATNVTKKAPAGLPQGYETLAEYFAKMLETVSAEAKYTPNEANLSVAGLQAKLNTLRQNNSGVTLAKISLSNARMKRDAVLYTDSVNLYDMAVAAKEYVKSVYGFNSEQYKQVVKINFTKPQK